MRSWLRPLLAAILTLAVVLTLAATVRTAAPEQAPASVPTAATTRPGPPPLRATRAGSHRVRVIWRHPAARGSSRITGYRIWRNGKDLAGRGVWHRTLSAPRRSVTVKGLRNGSRYTFSVAATSRSGHGRPARVRLVPRAGYRMAAATPGAPTITASSTGATTMRVSWAPPAVSGTSSITGYRVARDGTDAEGKGPWSTVVAATQRTFEMTLLRSGVTYTFSVSALNASGAGPAASV